MNDTDVLLTGIGFSLSCAVLYIIGINFNRWRQNRHLKRLVKEKASESHKGELLASLFFETPPKKSTYYWLLIPVFTINFTVFAIAESGKQVSDDSIWLNLWAFSIALNVLMIVGSLLWILLIYSVERLKPSLQMQDFITHEESALFKAVEENLSCGVLCLTDADDYYEIHYWKIADLDEILPIIQNREMLTGYIEILQTSRELEKTETALLTPEQIQRNEEFKRNFHERLEGLVPLLMNIGNATNQSYSSKEKSKVLNQQQIQAEFERKQREAERKLSEISHPEQVKPTVDKENTSESEAIRQLRIIANSDMVSAGIKEEAQNLIETIEKMTSEEQQLNEKKMVDMDAMSVIQASKLFYRLND